MRILPIVIAALALGGCNIVISPRPMFTVADSDELPGLRPGLWIEADPACVFDAATRVAAWPKCADPMIIEADRMIDPAKPGQPIPYLLTGGRPRILQARFDAAGGGVPDLGPAEGGPVAGYVFIGVDPAKIDAEGRIIEASAWQTLCGPPPPDSPSQKRPEDYVSRRPFPGLTVHHGSANCSPRTAAAVRGAVAGSRDLTVSPTVIRWVRDGKD